MSRIEVIHCFGKMNAGGAETLIYNVYKAIDKNRFHFSFLVFNSDSGFYDEDIKLPLVLISGSELIYGGIICFCGYILKGDFSFGTYLIHIILPELVYTILATLIVYQIILHINKKLEAEEQRSASRFV